MKSHCPNLNIIFFVIFLFGSLGVGKSSWAANWYVDNAATGSNNGTSWANGWRSFTQVVWGGSGVVAGDTLYISGGSVSKTYTATSHNMLTISASGSPGKPITVATGGKSPSPSGHDGQVILDGNGSYAGLVSSIGSNYLVIDGEKNGQRNLKLYNIKLGDDYGAMDISQGIDPIVRYVEIETAPIGIAFTSGSGGEIAYCYLHDIRREAAIRLNMTNGLTIGYDQTLVHDNVISLNSKMDGGGTGPNGIQGCYGLSVYNNTFTHSLAPIEGGQHSDFIQGQAHYLKIYNNDFKNITDSAVDFDGGGNTGWIQIWNNMFHVTSDLSVSLPTAIRIYSNSGAVTSFNDISIYNNTFVDVLGTTPVAFGYGGGNPSVSSVAIKNNIFYNTGRFQNNASLNIPARTGGGSWDIDYNLVSAGAHGEATLVVDGLSFIQAHGQAGTPIFVSYSERSNGNDFHLMAGDTSVRGLGIPLGVPYNYDKDGIPRPHGSAWDIGAYEYVQGEDTTPPAAPTGLRVN